MSKRRNFIETKGTQLGNPRKGPELGPPKSKSSGNYWKSIIHEDVRNPVPSSFLSKPGEYQHSFLFWAFLKQARNFFLEEEKKDIKTLDVEKPG